MDMQAGERVRRGFRRVGAAIAALAGLVGIGFCVGYGSLWMNATVPPPTSDWRSLQDASSIRAELRRMIDRSAPEAEMTAYLHGKGASTPDEIDRRNNALRDEAALLQGAILSIPIALGVATAIYAVVWVFGWIIRGFLQ
jgi:hypothetical protein